MVDDKLKSIVWFRLVNDVIRSPSGQGYGFSRGHVWM